MKISDKILSLPPYISTAWKNIVSIHVENRPYGHVLLIELITGSKAEVPNLEPKIMEKVFAMHALVLEQEGAQNHVATQTFAFPLPFPIEGLTSVLQHNPEQADTPPLPPEILEKIQSLKGVLPEDLSSMQKAEPHCNCPYCQITRAMTGVEATLAIAEEEVSAADLTFRNWDIKQAGDRLYSVTNPLDSKEHYNVFLGEPVGCTCGNRNCEHIQAVLRT
ncbi:MAG TPA: hypothetical protein VMR37_08240 [Rhabdochlamydiaceae bacterium]|jgi:hypothetical protein|nr:hypothetical protein [Rhabdochlamydiaceae bacterium]